MKKSLFATALLTLVSLPAFAQIGGIENSVADIADEIRAVFPVILEVIFLVEFLFNAGYSNINLQKIFSGEN